MKKCWLRDLRKEGFEGYVGSPLRFPAQAFARDFYRDHAQKQWFPLLEAYMISGASIPLFIVDAKEGDAVNRSREVQKKLRLVYGHVNERNRLHASDSIDNAQREASLIFSAYTSITQGKKKTMVIIIAQRKLLWNEEIRSKSLP